MLSTFKMKGIAFLTAAVACFHLYGNSGTAPEITTNLKLSTNYSLTLKIESFHFLYETEKGWHHGYDGTDIQFFGNYRLSPFLRLSAGYQYGIEHLKSNTHRTIQQVSILHREGIFALNHRFRADQTFYTSSPTKYRGRYRFSMEMPLQGKSIDPGEFYINASNELIFALQNGKNDFENRLVGQLGYVLNTKLRLQSGFDYRYFIKGDQTDYVIWYKLGIFLNI